MISLQKPFGLNISDFSIELVSLSGNIQNPKLLALGRKELPGGILEDGKILKKKELETFLKDLISQPDFGKVKTKKFVFSIPESKIFVHSFSISNSEKDILNQIKEKAKENFPYPLDELFFDYEMKENEVLIVACPREIINDYLDVFSNCKISPLAIESESLSLGRALIKEGEIVLILDVGSKFSNFILFDKGKLKLSISNPIAGNSFTKAISEKLKIPFQEAEKLKREIGLNPATNEGRVFFILQKEVQNLIDQIREIENYFFNKTSEEIGKVILTGGSATLPYLREYLAENLGKEVLIGDPLEKIDIEILRKKEYFKEALKINPYLYSVAIGSALRGLEKDPRRSGINLLKR
jgi:type IV pilus assembly protein PilM